MILLPAGWGGTPTPMCTAQPRTLLLLFAPQLWFSFQHSDVSFFTCTQPSCQPRTWDEVSHGILGPWMCASFSFSVPCPIKSAISADTNSSLFSSALCWGSTFLCTVLKVLLGWTLDKHGASFVCFPSLSWLPVVQFLKQPPRIFRLVLEWFSQMDKLIPVTSLLLEAQASLSLKLNF